MLKYYEKSIAEVIVMEKKRCCLIMTKKNIAEVTKKHKKKCCLELMKKKNIDQVRK